MGEAGEFDGFHIVSCVARRAGRRGRRSRVLAFRNDRGRTTDRVERRGPTSARGFPGRGATGRCLCRGGSCLSIRARAPGTRSSSIRANAISTSSSRTIGPSAMASASGASVSNGRASGAWLQKQEWPDWRAPPEMVGRQPYLPRFMAGGPGNPLGARALYLGHSVFRIHGTNQPETIGHAVSSGCFSPRQRRRDRPLRPRPGRRKSPRQAVGPRFLMRTRGLKIRSVRIEDAAAPTGSKGTASRAIPAPRPSTRGWSRRERSAEGERPADLQTTGRGPHPVYFGTPLCRRKITMRASARLLFAIAFIGGMDNAALAGSRASLAELFGARL